MPCSAGATAPGVRGPPSSNLWSGCPFPSLSPECPCSVLFSPPATFSDKSGRDTPGGRQGLRDRAERFVMWPLRRREGPMGRSLRLSLGA